MRIAITGASGFVGTALTAALRSAGHDVVRLVRRAEPAADAVGWQPDTGAVDTAKLGAIDAVVNLAGANIAQGRWTKARKAAIVDSRVPATERLCRTLAALPHPPRVLVSTSAIGFYGDRGDEALDERSGPGTGFLADVTRAWEAATRPAEAAGVRVVLPRFGMVLDPKGGALARMLLPFRLGIGGRLGNGRQWLSWITRHDLVRAITFLLLDGPPARRADDALRGPVLAVAPSPVTNRDFTQALGRALHRPTALAVPAVVLRAVFGRMADELFLTSQRATPERLLAAGFTFDHPTLKSAFAALFPRRTP